MAMNLKQDSTTKMLDDMHDMCQKIRVPKEEYWTANYRRLSGLHEEDIKGVVTTRTGQQYKTTSPRGHPREAKAAILNVSDRRHKKWLSQLVAQARNFQAIGSSNNDKDVEAAQGASAMLKGRMASHGGVDLMQWFENAANVRCTDLSFMLVEGDPTIHRPLKLVDGGKILRGDVILKTRNAWWVDWYPGIPDQRKSPAIGITEFFTRNEMERRWKTFPKKPIPAEWPKGSHMVELEPGIEESLYRVRRLFILPSSLFPNGAQRIELGSNPETDILKTWLPDAQLAEKGGPVPKKKRGRKHEWIGTPDNQHPIVPFRAVPLNEASCGRGTMHITGNIQIPLNYAWTHLFNLLEQSPSAIFTHPATGQITPEKVVSGPGIVVLPYQTIAGQKLEWVGPPTEAIRAWLEVATFCVQMLDDVFGQPAESRGQTKGGRQSGKALELAETLSQTTAAPEIMLFQASSAEVQMRILIEGQRVWPDEFVYDAIGDNKKLEAKLFKKADLTSIVDVRMSPDSPLPKNLEARWKFGIMKLDKGGYGPIEDPRTLKKFNDDIGMPSDDEVLRDEQVQNQAGRKEPDAMKEKKTEAPVHLSDDDMQHLSHHMRLLAEELAQDRAGTDGEYPQRVVRHTMLHKFNLERKQELEGAKLPAGEPSEELHYKDIETERDKMSDMTVQAQEAQAEAQGAMQMLEMMREGAPAEEAQQAAQAAQAGAPAEAPVGAVQGVG